MNTDYQNGNTCIQNNSNEGSGPNDPIEQMTT